MRVSNPLLARLPVPVPAAKAVGAPAVFQPIHGAAKVANPRTISHRPSDCLAIRSGRFEVAAGRGRSVG